MCLRRYVVIADPRIYIRVDVTYQMVLFTTTYDILVPYNNGNYGFKNKIKSILQTRTSPVYNYNNYHESSHSNTVARCDE
jgi:hypothetical protein